MIRTQSLVHYFLRKVYKKKVRSKIVPLFIFCATCICTFQALNPHPAIIQEPDLSIAFASTDCPPFSIQQTLLDAIDKAKSHIDIGIYALHDRSIIQHLKDAAEKRGVSISVLVDPSATVDAQTTLGPKIRVFERSASGLMHIKILIIDESLVWFGTMNYTKTSLQTHGNIACGIRSAALAKECRKYLQILINKEKRPAIFPIKLSGENALSPKIFFSLHPEGAKRSLIELIDRIDRAQTRVFVAMYTFTNSDIGNALIRAKKRQIDVRVLFDKDSSHETSKKIFNILRVSAIPVGIRKKEGLLHYKCALIDSSFVIGSANWTKAGFGINAETFSILDNIPQELMIFLDQWWQRVELDATLTKE